MSVRYFVVDKDHLLCDEHGTPALLTGGMVDGAICLGFGEVHDETPTTSPHNDFAIDKSDAIKAGLIIAYGDKYDSTTLKSLSFLPYRQVIAHTDLSTAHAMSRAVQLVLWRRDHRFCSRCGAATTPHRHEHAMMCGHCRHRAYPRVQPCVIVAITRIHPTTQKRQILLALHQRHKDSGMYGLVAGFVEAGESLESAVHREVAEEVGLGVTNLRYAGSQPWPYPTNLMLGFIADYQSGEIVVQENELVEAKFFDVDQLPHIPKPSTIAHALIKQVVSLPVSN